ncbi:MAG: DUF45 domain-containing protein [Acholeplasmataceae bacterium]|nr:DUF45 domain-containing protein [Acholeplasmataceae bacterium]
MKTYTKNGKTIAYVITRKHIKNTYFRMKNDYLSITTHPRVKETQILAFLHEKFEKLYEKITKFQQIESMNQLVLWGKTYDLIIEENPRFLYHIQDDEVIVYGRKNHYDDIKKRIYKIEMKRMIDVLKPIFEPVLVKNDIQIVCYKIKYLKSKFGSYHLRKNEITLNSFLVKLDPIFLQYVIYHEYAHARIPNHSKAFYQLLGELMPNHKQYQKDLKKIAII